MTAYLAVGVEEVPHTLAVDLHVADLSIRGIKGVSELNADLWHDRLIPLY